MRSSLPVSWFWFALPLLGCGDTGPSGDTGDTAGEVDGDTDASDTPHEVDGLDPGCDLPGDPDFDDHTRSSLPTRRCFDELAASTSDPATVKFVILDVSKVTEPRADEADLRFSDSGFYSLHDEWFWFRLLNGQRIPGRDIAPLDGMSFPTIASVYAHYAGQTTLPLDLTRLGATGPFPGRIYSPEFYRLAGLTATGTTPAEKPPFIGLGTVVHFEANALRRFPDEIWGFELEYGHVPTLAEVVRYFLMLEAKLPPEAKGKLRWIARSPTQRTIAKNLADSGHPFGQRTLTYDDLVVDGRVEVYNEGIAAGYVEVFPPSFAPSDLRANQLAVIPLVPDDVPPTRAIISAVPQTALAHVNLLAKARGTPNAHVAGILESAQIRDWDYLSVPLIFEAKADSVRWKPITSTQYNGYLALIAPPERHIAQVDLASAPLTVDLSEGSIAGMSALVPLTGGKAAGFLSFLELPGLETPDWPMALTIRAFREHLAPLEPLLREALAEQDFADDPRVRFLTLEGEAAYRAANANNPAALALITDLANRHSGRALGTILAAGGVKKMIISRPMDTATLRAIREVLVERYAPLAKTQGLRFRSSSTAEDVPGFNGAGLYVSNTGFLYPSELGDPNDRHQTIEWAIKETWASYWGFQAYEERRDGRLDHFEGAMGVAIHARFDDELETANAVMTFWWGDYPDASSRRLVVNVQEGSLAVTNPGGTSELPEIDEVFLMPGESTPTIRRVQHSTLSPDAWLFSDEVLLELFEQAQAHTGRWLSVSTVSTTNAEKPRTIVLDYELKSMRAGWPAMADGTVRPARIIWRQARVLDQVARVGGQTDPFTPGFPLTTFLPQDLRTVAQQVVVERCASPELELRVYAVYSDPGQRDLFPFADTPLMYRVWVDFNEVPEGFDVELVARVVPWTGLGERRFASAGAPHRVVFDASQADALGIDGFELTRPSGETRGRARYWRGGLERELECLAYVARTPYQSASDYLRQLLASP
jgi:hypothetical protein